MRPPSKFVELTPSEQQRLEEHWHHGESARVRQRAQAVLLSHRQYTLNEIAEIFQVHRDTVAAWIKAWEKDQEAGLSDGERSGAPPKLDPKEQQQTLEWLKKQPHQPKQVLARVQEETGKSISSKTLARIAKRAGFS